MNSTRFKIAEHVFEIESQEVDIVKLLPNLEPFLTDEEQEPLLSRKVFQIPSASATVRLRGRLIREDTP